MNDQSEMFVFAGMLLAFASVAAARVALALWGHYKFERAYRKHPRVVKYNQYQACQSSHKWQEFKLAVRRLDPGTYKVCMDCGSIAGNFQYMVSNELLDQAAEVLKKAEAKAEMERKIQSMVAAIVDHRISEFILREFAKESSDPTFVNKLMELAEFTLASQEQAIGEVATKLEFQGISENGDTYSWSPLDVDLSRMKGNA